MIRPEPFTTERALGWLGVASVTVAVLAWIALVLHYEYQVVWLGDYVVAEDALFLAGLAGIVVTRSVQRWGAARVRPVAWRFLFSIAVVAVALIIAEVGARYVLRTVVPARSPRVSLNSLAFRDREVGPKNPLRYRIAIIGDSFTFGNGVEERDRFSNLLQGFLGSDYEVLNFGYPGHNLPEHLEELEQVLPMKPDFVLLQLYENDFETPDMMHHRPRTYPLIPLGLDERLQRTSLLYHILIDHWIDLQESVGLAERYTDYMARHLRDPQAADAVMTTGMLTQFIVRAREAGVPSGGVFFPAIYALDGKAAVYPFAYLNERVTKLYGDLLTPYLDLLPAFRTIRDPRTLWVSPFDPHPNAKANHLAAVAILNRFESLWHH